MKSLLMTLAVLVGLAGGVDLAKAQDPAKPQEQTPPTKQGFLGLLVEEVPPALASQMPDLLPKGQGVLVQQVANDSPAAKAGLQAHDILLTINEQKLQSPEQLVKLVRDAKPGTEVNIDYLRAGKTANVKVALGEAKLPMLPDRSRIFKLLPDERFRKMFEELESKIDADAWDSFVSMKLTKQDNQRWRADIEVRGKDGNKVTREFTGTREEIRKAIQSDSELTEQNRTHLLRALNLQQPAFEFHFPPNGNNGSGNRNEP